MQKIIVIIIVAPIVFAVLMAGVRNYTGEVATLYTVDDGGRAFTSQVWVVEEKHKLWIRSLRPGSSWLERVSDQPKVQLKRNGVMKTYRATVLPHRKDSINALMAQEYGLADWLLAKFESRDEAVPIYLDPFS